jgi:hypothetical protein
MTVLKDHVQLGPQTAELHAAAGLADRIRYDSPEAQQYDAIVNATWPAIEAAQTHAARALDADGIAVAAVAGLGGCVWGHVALALAARHLIGRAPGWTPDAYATLTRPWVAALGPIHPDDIPQED